MLWQSALGPQGRPHVNQAIRLPRLAELCLDRRSRLEVTTTKYLT